MINIKNWMDNFSKQAERTFPGRICFLGLQGSYGRGEATEASDIDVVLILDELTADDLAAYQSMLAAMPGRELICGFVSGKTELLNWESSDLFQFCYDTVPFKGALDFLFERLDRQAVRRAIRIGACNLYHTCVHNFVHERSGDILRALYKSAVFVIQAVVFWQTGSYIKTKEKLISAAAAPAKRILETERKLKNGNGTEFDPASETLFNWLKSVLEEFKE
ncbi:MAG: nucleotidyltransferase domain-containing protein [Clostridia bacterium]|nr:nucleotidyltransferase domain-containing protein [Clostridia bacterium]